MAIAVSKNRLVEAIVVSKDGLVEANVESKTGYKCGNTGQMKLVL